MASSKKIVLESSDGELFEVHEAVALQFETIRPLVEKDCDDNCIRIPNVSSKILAMAIEYSKKHVDAKVSEDDLNAWDREFVNLDQATLFDLLLAANYLELKSLLDLISMTIANMMKGKTPEEIRRTFDVKDDFTPEEMGF